MKTGQKNEPLCEQFPRTYLLQLFVKMRLDYVIKIWEQRVITWHRKKAYEAELQ